MSLKNTINKQDISEEKIKEIFSNKKENESSNNYEKEIITIKESDKVTKMRRPTFEMPENDHQKLKAICAFQGKDVGKTLYAVVKKWLDSIELSL